MTGRAKIGFGEEIDSFDPGAWEKLDKEPRTPLDEKQAKKAAQLSGFLSREPTTQPPATPEASLNLPPAQQRRRRTGRNIQFNLKARAETIEAFCRIADERGIGLGEALELATDLMVKHHAQSKSIG